jgi:hypothetical protein
LRVTPRVNISSDASPKLILRDSAQVATRIRQTSCGPDLTNNLGLAETQDHCGAMSIWDVASGGRMGMVTGEDATEVANPPTNCTSDCQSQNQVQRRLANLRFPAPVTTTSWLTPPYLHRRAVDPSQRTVKILRNTRRGSVRDHRTGSSNCIHGRTN